MRLHQLLDDVAKHFPAPSVQQTMMERPCLLLRRQHQRLRVSTASDQNRIDDLSVDITGEGIVRKIRFLADLVGNLLFEIVFVGRLEIMTVLVLFTPFRSKVVNRVLLGVTLFLNVYWTAYLFNCFLSGGWIFT